MPDTQTRPLSPPPLPFVLLQELNVFGRNNEPSDDLRFDLRPEPEPTPGCLNFFRKKKKRGAPVSYSASEGTPPTNSQNSNPER